MVPAKHAQTTCTADFVAQSLAHSRVRQVLCLSSLRSGLCDSNRLDPEPSARLAEQNSYARAPRRDARARENVWSTSTLRRAAARVQAPRHNSEHAAQPTEASLDVGDGELAAGELSLEHRTLPSEVLDLCVLSPKLLPRLV